MAVPTLKMHVPNLSYVPGTSRCHCRLTVTRLISSQNLIKQWPMSRLTRL